MWQWWVWLMAFLYSGGVVVEDVQWWVWQWWVWLMAFLYSGGVVVEDVAVVGVAHGIPL